MIFVANYNWIDFIFTRFYAFSQENSIKVGLVDNKILIYIYLYIFGY